MQKQSSLFSCDSEWPPCDKGRVVEVDSHPNWSGCQGIPFFSLDVKSYHNWKYLGGHYTIMVLWGLIRLPCEMVREKMWNRSLAEDFPKKWLALLLDVQIDYSWWEEKSFSSGRSKCSLDSAYNWRTFSSKLHFDTNSTILYFYPNSTKL